MSKLRKQKNRGGFWVLIQFSLMGLLVWASYLWQSPWRASNTFFAVGGGVFFVGTFFIQGGVRALGQYLTVFPKPLDDGKLITSGVYALVRHPLYTSVILCSLGWCLCWQSLPALGVWCVLVVFLDAKARFEEAMLMARFPEYQDYAARVKRLIPWVY